MGFKIQMLVLIYEFATTFGINNPIASDKLMLRNFNNWADYSSNAVYYHAYMALLNQVVYCHSDSGDKF